MFEDDERFKAVEKEADRQDLFRNYLVDLQKKVTRFWSCFISSHMILLILKWTCESDLITMVYENLGKCQGSGGASPE